MSPLSCMELESLPFNHSSPVDARFHFQQWTFPPVSGCGYVSGGINERLRLGAKCGSAERMSGCCPAIYRNGVLDIEQSNGDAADVLSGAPQYNVASLAMKGLDGG